MIKSKIQILCPFLLSILLISCFKTNKHKSTFKVCDKKLFVEIYEVNSFGLKAQYLTDSTHFRKYIGDWDDEHENYLYTCEDDTLYIIKTIRGNRWAEWDTAANGMVSVISNLDTLKNLKFCISKLKMQNNFK